MSTINANALLDKEFLQEQGLDETLVTNPAGDGQHSGAPSDAAALAVTASSYKRTPTNGDAESVDSTTRVNTSLKQVDVLKDVRARLLHGIKATYGEGFHKGYISPSQSLDLISVVDISLDNLDKAIRDWELLEPHAKIHAFVAFMQAQEDKTCGPLKQIPRGMLFDGIENGVVLANSYVYAHKTTRERLQSVFKEVDNESMDPETRRLALNAVEIVLQESADGCKKAVKFIKGLRHSFPEVIRAVKTKLVALTVLRRKGKFVEHLFEGGLIEQKDYDLLTTAIIRQSTRLSLGGWNTNDMPEPKDLMYHHHMFNNMSRDVFDKEVLPHAIHRVFREKEHIFRKGDSPTSFFMIIRGSTISVKDEDDPIGSSQADHNASLVGISEMLLAVPRFRTVTAAGLAEGYEFKLESFAQLMSSHLVIEKVAWKQCGATLAQYKGDDIIKGLSPEEQMEWFMRSEVYLPGKEEYVHITGTTYFVYGQMTTVLTGRQIGTREPQTYDAPKALGPEFMHLRVNSPYVVFLSLPSQATSRAYEARDQHILKQMSMQPGSRSVRGLHEAKSMDSRRLEKTASKEASFLSKMSMRHVAHAAHGGHSSYRPNRRSMEIREDEREGRKERTNDILSRLSRTVKDVPYELPESRSLEFEDNGRQSIQE